MDSQGPSLSEGFPEHETGASNRLEDSNGEGLGSPVLINIVIRLFSLVCQVLNNCFEFRHQLIVVLLI